MLARNATLRREQRCRSVGEVITRDRTEFCPARGARRKCFDGEEFARAPGHACLNSFLLSDPWTPTSSSDLTRTPERRWRCGSTAAATYASRHSQVEAANGCGSGRRAKWIRRRARSRGREESRAYRLDVANRVRAHHRGLRGIRCNGDNATDMWGLGCSELFAFARRLTTWVHRSVAERARCVVLDWPTDEMVPPGGARLLPIGPRGGEAKWADCVVRLDGLPFFFCYFNFLFSPSHFFPKFKLNFQSEFNSCGEFVLNLMYHWMQQLNKIYSYF
jgi:hypothetical protein